MARRASSSARRRKMVCSHLCSLSSACCCWSRWCFSGLPCGHQHLPQCQCELEMEQKELLRLHCHLLLHQEQLHAETGKTRFWTLRCPVGRGTATERIVICNLQVFWHLTLRNHHWSLLQLNWILFYTKQLKYLAQSSIAISESWLLAIPRGMSQIFVHFYIHHIFRKRKVQAVSAAHLFNRDHSKNMKDRGGFFNLANNV